MQDDTSSSGYRCSEPGKFTTTTFPPSPQYTPVLDGNIVCTPEYVITGLERSRELANGSVTAPAKQDYVRMLLRK